MQQSCVYPQLPLEKKLDFPLYLGYKYYSMAKTTKELLEDLKENGERITTVRRALIQILSKKSHACICPGNP
jgi:hypothetical protein